MGPRKESSLEAVPAGQPREGSHLDKGTKDLLVIIVIMVIIIAGFYIVLRMGIDFSEVAPDAPM